MTKMKHAFANSYKDVRENLSSLWRLLVERLRKTAFLDENIQKKVADVAAMPFMLDVFTTLKQEAIIASRVVKSKTALKISPNHLNWKLQPRAKDVEKSLKSVQLLSNK